MQIDIISLFPEYFAPLDVSLLGRARAQGLATIDVHDLRTWTSDPRRTVDGVPFGGGPGMVLRPEPWGAALDALLARAPRDRPCLLVPTPSGQPFTQSLARDLATEPWLVFACGRYEGIDARVVEDAATLMPVTEVSVGDYVLAGGEVATLVMLEAITRLLPGVVGNPASIAEDSFSVGGGGALVEGPVYTRPAVWRGRAVPEVLRSGDHAAIARWKREQAERRTAERRPDLLTGKLPPTFPGVAQ